MQSRASECGAFATLTRSERAAAFDVPSGDPYVHPTMTLIGSTPPLHPRGGRPVDADVSIGDLIRTAQSGDPAAAGALFAALYDELHAIAERQLRRGGPELTLGTTTLLHEAYLNLSEREGARFVSRGHFLAYAARAMRGLTIDYVRRRQAKKRGGEFQITTSGVEQVGDVPAGRAAGAAERGARHARRERARSRPADRPALLLRLYLRRAGRAAGRVRAHHSAALAQRPPPFAPHHAGSLSRVTTSTE